MHLPFDLFKSAVFLQNLGDLDASVLLLIIFQNSDEDAADGKGGGVIHVDKLYFAVLSF